MLFCKKIMDKMETKPETSQEFFKRVMHKIFTEKKHVLDIGGGLRISKERGDRFDESKEWLAFLTKNVDYKIMDPVPDYNPDIIGDIHQMPFKSNSWEAIICSSVLEHVE